MSADMYVLKYRVRSVPVTYHYRDPQKRDQHAAEIITAGGSVAMWTEKRVSPPPQVHA